MKLIIEHAMTKSEITKDLKDKSEIVLYHLIYLYIWPNTEYKNHWEKEIYSILSDTYKWAKTNKYLDKDIIYHYTFGYIEDIFLDNVEYYIDKVSVLENKLVEVNMIDKENLFNFVKDYFYWLSEELSKQGRVLSNQVYSKIDSLLEKYSIK